MNDIALGNKSIGDNHPAFIIAEMAWAHDGSPSKARKIVDAAIRAGANAINLHFTSMPDYMVPHYGNGPGRISAGRQEKSIYSYLENINLTEQVCRALTQYAREYGLAVTIMPNDIPSVTLAAGMQPDALVVGAASFADERMLRALARCGRPLLLRTGGASLGEIERTVFLLRAMGVKDLVLIHGFQSYPTKLEEVNLRFITTLRQMFGLHVGFEDHTDAGDPLALVISLLALPFGARVLGKHLTHDRSERGEDFESSLDPGDFTKFVRWVRECEKTLGSEQVRPFSTDELNYRQVVRKRMVAMQLIRHGEKLDPEAVTFKRADEGIHPDEAQFAFRRAASVDIQPNEPITWEKLA
jgi:sialic acid synthase SpsE